MILTYFDGIEFSNIISTLQMIEGDSVYYITLSQLGWSGFMLRNMIPSSYWLSFCQATRNTSRLIKTLFYSSLAWQIALMSLIYHAMMIDSSQGIYSFFH